MEHNLFKTILSIVKVLLYSKFMGQLKYQKGNKTCNILANGPSLNQSIIKYFDDFVNSDLFVVNHFAFSPYFFELKPKYYILVAPEFYKEDVDLSIQETNKKLFEILSKKVSWELTLIVPFIGKENNNLRNINNKKVKYLYVNSTSIEGYSWFCNWSMKKGLGMPRPHNVLIPSLVSALNLGYRHVNIFGADHSWLSEVFVTNDNRVLLSQKHFYDYEKAKPEPMNKGGKGERKLHEILQKWMYSFLGYFIIKKYALSIKAEIINKTPNSLIDAFDKQY